MKYNLECTICGTVQESENWIPITKCEIHRERLNKKTAQADVIVRSLDIYKTSESSRND